MDGSTIRFYRQQRGMTLRQLAGDEFSPSYISRIEHGYVKVTSRVNRVLAAKLMADSDQFYEPGHDGHTIDVLLTIVLALSQRADTTDDALVVIQHAFLLATQSRRPLVSARILAVHGYLLAKWGRTVPGDLIRQFLTVSAWNDQDPLDRQRWLDALHLFGTTFTLDDNPLTRRTALETVPTANLDTGLGQ